MPATKLQSYLDQHGIKYLVIQHSPAHTSQEVAARMHIHGWELAKTTIVKLDGALAMAVLPAPSRVDVEMLRRVTGAHSAALATEKEFEHLFPGCDLGAMPPFGNLYGLAVYVDEQLVTGGSIVFKAGTHGEVIRMEFPDFQRLVQPRIYAFAQVEDVAERCSHGALVEQA
jgi:Ala-tRNA(Pro) deacylase